MTRAASWVEARRLVVEEGWAYREVAEATGIPLSTLQKRGAAEDWQSQRELGASYTAQFRALKVAQLKRAQEGGDPQAIYALLKLEAAFPEFRYARQGAVDAGTRRQLALEFLERVVAYLEAEDRNALAVLQPHLATLAERLVSEET